MHGRFEWRPLVIGLVISVAFATVVRWLSGMPFWICWLIAILAMVVNGYIATWEDEQPGGFNNPS